MKRTVPFTKTITFRTMIAEITNIEVKHTLELRNDHEIEGDILVDGTYKMTDASQIEEDFHYKLPFTIDIDSKYDLENLEITVGDFYFEIINEEDLKINVEIEMDGIEEKQQEMVETQLSLEDSLEVLDSQLGSEVELTRGKEEEVIPIPLEVEMNTNHPLESLNQEIEEDMKEENLTPLPSFESPIVENPQPSLSSNNVSSIFSSLTSSEETFSTYYVYMVREEDSLESILEKYQTTREEIQNYNDLTEIKVGSKLIIPCVNHE